MKWFTTGLLAAIGFTAFAQTPGNAPASTASGHDLNDMLKNHLQYIQSGSADRVTYEVYDIAATWAAAGFMDQANYLLETYWAYKPAPADTRYIQDAFTVLWAVSGKRPAAVPFEERELRYIEQENRDAALNPHQWSATFTTRLRSSLANSCQKGDSSRCGVGCRSMWLQSVHWSNKYCSSWLCCFFPNL